MPRSLTSSPQPTFLGVECGGTRTVALLVDAAGRLLERVEAGPANWRLLGGSGLRRHLRALARKFSNPAAIAIGMAGVRGEDDREKVRQVATSVWRRTPIHTCHDLETALWAAGGSPDVTPRVIVLSGTGSCCYGRNPGGKTVKMGGWGHLLGDKGSGFEIGLRALKAVVYFLDRDNQWTRLGERILGSLQLNDPEQLIGWVQTAGKEQVAALAVQVFSAADERDPIARDILRGAAAILAKDAAACAGRLTPHGGPVEFVFAGSVLQKQTKFAAQVRRLIQERFPGARFTKLNRETAWGAVELARQSRTGFLLAAGASHATPAVGQNSTAMATAQSRTTTTLADAGGDWLEARPTSPTEQRNSRSLNLDRMSVDEVIGLMLSEDAKLPAAIRRERAVIGRLIGWVVRSFKQGGRLFYVGAGTSGRLGILDASECPPTFRTPPEMVQGIIAGGQQAIWSAVEGAEDDGEAGGRAITFRGITRKDVVVGIAASGRTPFVWGALREAKRRKAKTALLCFNPHLQIAAKDRLSAVICPRIGPEVLTGSTRLKSGTATKLILNMITTIAMVRIGKVVGNLMVDLNPSNVKLRDRAVRIVATLTQCSVEECRTALIKSGWDVKRAIQRLGGRANNAR
ncbi:MAG TPA: N-acetylmuramic acid 6-phosphate etherase [Verrucomicrobiales bacterium]|nr:N-acetylmuramic acid 6-phosphate etherase [Verrucomicrobiales bacterium]